jgi:hypothetical protein
VVNEVVDVELDENQKRNSWADYFYKIREQCPWSLAAWNKGLIDIVPWQGEVIPLGRYQARMYTVTMTNTELEQLAYDLDQGDCVWLYSHPDAGPWATPTSVLIQQDRRELTRLRLSLKET